MASQSDSKIETNKDNDSETEDELVMAETTDGQCRASDGEDADDQMESGSEPDEEKRRQALEDIRRIAEEFEFLKDRFYQEKVAALDTEIQEVTDGIHAEYVKRIEALDTEKEERLQVLDLYAKMELESLDIAIRFEKDLASKSLESKKADFRARLFETLHQRKRRLETMQKHTEQIEAELSDARSIKQNIKAASKQRRQPEPQKPDKKKFKAQLVEWPFIVYRLRDAEIQEDLNSIKRAIKNSRRPQSKPGDRDIDVYFEDGKLFYDKRWFERGQHIWVENKDQPHYSGDITAINTSEVWVQRADGARSKIYVSQLRLGKYAIRPRID